MSDRHSDPDRVSAERPSQERPSQERPSQERAGAASTAAESAKRVREPANGGNQSGHPREAANSAAGASGQDDLASAQTEVEELRSRVRDAEDSRLRALADLDNLRKRCAGLAERAAAEARAAVAAEWLPVVDDLDRALEHSQADPEVIIQGVRSVRDQALRVLAGLGYPRRDDVGAAFDPARHDAVAVHSDPDVAAGTVIHVVRPGYGDGEHVLRPAQVVVAKAE
jgi:molecular chaperone GrpE